MHLHAASPLIPSGVARGEVSLVVAAARITSSCASMAKTSVFQPPASGPNCTCVRSSATDYDYDLTAAQPSQHQKAS